MKSKEKYICCICAEGHEGFGNNPRPVKIAGRCCDSCDNNMVIPTRIINAKKGLINMSRRSTANDLLIEVIQFIDRKYSYPITKDLDNYKSEAGALRFKVDRYLNKKDYNYNHINKKLKQAQEVA